LLCVAIAAFLVSCGKGGIPPASLHLTQISTEKKQRQTRILHGSSRAEIFSASKQAMENLGFSYNKHKSEDALGLIIARKRSEIDMRLMDVLGVVLLIPTGGESLYFFDCPVDCSDGPLTKVIEASIVIREVTGATTESHFVRLALRRLVWSRNTVTQTELFDKRLYSQFFDELSEILSVKAQRI